MMLTEEMINPFIRCVGYGKGIFQSTLCCAYDYRLVYFTEGIGEVLCGEDTYHTEAGDLFIFAPGTPFSVRSSSTQRCIVVNFDWTQNRADISSPVLSVEYAHFSEAKVIEKVDLSLFAQRNDRIQIRQFFEGEDILRQLHKVYFADVNPNVIYLSGLMKQLIGILFGRLSRGQQKNEKHFLLAKQIVSYIQEHYAEKLTLETIAAHFHYHPTYINRAMKAATGVSFHQHLINYRLKCSLQFLEAKDLTMEEIAEKTGFSNSKHFSTCFKKHFKISPSQYALCQI